MEALPPRPRTQTVWSYLQLLHAHAAAVLAAARLCSDRNAAADVDYTAAIRYLEETAIRTEAKAPLCVRVLLTYARCAREGGRDGKHRGALEAAGRVGKQWNLSVPQPSVGYGGQDDEETGQLEDPRVGPSLPTPTPTFLGSGRRSRWDAARPLAHRLAAESDPTVVRCTNP